MTSFNRNFPKRNDGNPETLAFIGSPETVVAMALAGRLDFDPTRDTLTDADGNEVRLPEPVGVELPDGGFDRGEEVFVAPTGDDSVEVEIAAGLRAAAAAGAVPGLGRRGPRRACRCCSRPRASAPPTTSRWPARGCGSAATSRTSPATCSSARSTPSPARPARARTCVDDDERVPFPELAKRWHEQGVEWVVVGDENYGEGSSREHAAMEPRFRGCRAVIVRSFARIHETNLKKQGVLPLTFADPADYDKVQEHDRVAITGLADLAPGRDLTVTLTHEDGTTDSFPVRHTLSDEQIEWFRAGSALNLIRARRLRADIPARSSAAPGIPGAAACDTVPCRPHARWSGT